MAAIEFLHGSFEWRQPCTNSFSKLAYNQAGFPNIMLAGRQKPGSFSVLQAGRAIAALLVLLYHNNNTIFGLGKYWSSRPLGPLLEFGHAGVEFFFVLSGFIILHAHWDDLDQPERLLSFFWKRFRRIYPVYWVLLLLLLPIYSVMPSFGTGHEAAFPVIVSSFTLVHVLDFDHAIIGVSWSLFHEILFYVLFAVAIWNLRVGLVVLALWLMSSLAALVLGSLSAAEYFYMNPMHLLFGMGMVAAWMLRRGRVAMPLTMALVGAVIFFGAGLEEDYVRYLPHDLRSLMFGLGSVLMVTGLVELERSQRLCVPAPLRFLGDASYSIYLVHFAALSFLAKFTSTVAGHVPLNPALAFFLLTVLALGAGIAYHRYVELPLLRRLSHRPVPAKAIQVSKSYSKRTPTGVASRG